MLNPATNNLTIALDENQNIYRPKGQWKELGIDARGRVHKLPGVYQNTSEIADFAARFLGRKGGGQEKAEPQLKLFEDFYDFHGPHPELCRFKTLDLLVAGIAEKAATVLKAEEYPLSEVAVLFALKKKIGVISRLVI